MTCSEGGERINGGGGEEGGREGFCQLRCIHSIELP